MSSKLRELADRLSGAKAKRKKARMDRAALGLEIWLPTHPITRTSKRKP